MKPPLLLRSIGVAVTTATLLVLGLGMLFLPRKGDERAIVLHPSEMMRAARFNPLPDLRMDGASTRDFGVIVASLRSDPSGKVIDVEILEATTPADGQRARTALTDWRLVLDQRSRRGRVGKVIIYYDTRQVFMLDGTAR